MAQIFSNVAVSRTLLILTLCAFQMFMFAYKAVFSCCKF